MRDSSQFRRQSGLLNVEEIQQLTVMLVGTGSLGSFSALMLAKLGVENFILIDPDQVEEHNLPMQFYKKSQLGEHKAQALRDLLGEFEGVNAIAITDKFSRVQLRHSDVNVLISAVDNMKTRKQIWNAFKRERVDLFIDVRAGGNVSEVYTVKKDDNKAYEFYENNLFDDKEGQNLPCTERMTTYTAGIIGSLTASTVAQYVNGNNTPVQRIIDPVNSIILCDTIDHNDNHEDNKGDSNE